MNRRCRMVVRVGVLLLALAGSGACGGMPADRAATADATAAAAIILSATPPARPAQAASGAPAPTPSPTSLAPATPTMAPTPTPIPSRTPTPPPSPPALVAPTLAASPADRPTAPSTLTPSATPALYTDAWAAGILWDEARTILYVGNSGVNIYDRRIPITPADEEIRRRLAQIPLGALIVAWGDYTPAGGERGAMLVRRADLVHLPYTTDMPLDAIYTWEASELSFAYPSGWRVTADGAHIELTNLPPGRQRYWGPGLMYFDPTTVWMDFGWHGGVPVAELVADLVADANQPDEPPLGEYRSYTVAEIELGPWPVTRLTQETLFGTWIQYLLAVNGQVFSLATRASSAPLAERIVATFR